MIAPGRSTLVLFLSLSIPAGAQPDAGSVEFFEKNIRPVLARRCAACHNAKLEAPKGGLRVDSADGLRKGGDSGPAIVAGAPERSLLLRAVSYKHELRMPPAGKLPDEEIADLAAWIGAGAPDPRTDSAPAVRAESAPIDRSWWSLQPVRKPALPPVKDAAWPQSPIDRFLLASMEKAGLAPARPADKRTLIRRVTYDLIGLPPSPEEIRAFLEDESAAAFARVVDRLLASPHYGERWARHWLDLVRYAETNGHEYDNDKLDPWRYRDYVIRAFNEDLPYDRFVREHIAGDLLPQPRLRSDGDALESPVGTTAFWFGEVLNSATDSIKSRADEVDNQIDVASKAFQGLTVACARCHDHKFDPIPTTDYYALAGVFHSTALREASIDSPARAARIRALSDRILALAPPQPASPLTYAYRPEDKPFESFNGGFGKWQTQGAAFRENPLHGAADSRAAGHDIFVGTLTSPKFRTGKELYLHVRLGGTKADPDLRERGPLRFTIVADGYKGQHIVPDGAPGSKWRTLTLTFERERIVYFEIVDRSREGHIFVDEIVFSDLKTPPAEPSGALPAAAPVSAEADAIAAQVPPSEFAMVATDLDCRDVALHIRGNHKNLGTPVARRYLQAVEAAPWKAPGSASGRFQLAESLASPANPLTARVMVNRIWAHHFGQGLVRTADNFGRTGEPPTNPDLLDFLAASFVENGWSVKAMHRMMLLSAAYRMSSEVSGEARRLDPSNKLLSHMPVRRLEAEAVRDAMLAVSGSLNRSLYGPSVPPHIGPWQNGRGKPASGPVDGSGRRSIYIQVRRNFMTPFFLAFDYPSPISTIGARTVSTVPSQALLLMNNEFVAQQAQRWASRLVRLSDPAARVGALYEAAFARAPAPRETLEILAFAQAQSERPEPEVWADIAHTIFNTAEFLYLP